MAQNAEIANNNIERVKALPFEIVKAMFPTAYLAVIGQVWCVEYMGHKKDANGVKTKEMFVKGHWETVTDPRKFDNLQIAWEWARFKYSKGHARVTTIIPELEPKQTFHNVIMSDR